MAMNMEVGETSGVTSDARPADSPDDANLERAVDASTPGSEPSPRAGDDVTAEGPVDARPTTSNGDATGQRREEAARSSTDDGDGRRAPQTPLAFTIDFGNNKEVDTARYQNLFERYNARHRRNLSTSKVLKILSFLTYVLYK